MWQRHSSLQLTRQKDVISSEPHLRIGMSGSKRHLFQIINDVDILIFLAKNCVAENSSKQCTLQSLVYAVNLARMTSHDFRNYPYGLFLLVIYIFTKIFCLDKNDTIKKYFSIIFTMHESVYKYMAMFLLLYFMLLFNFF